MPFDDPEFLAQLAQRGIMHRPGLAREMIDDLAPLLAAEGIDLDHAENLSLDEVNAALARATERHNLELFTPVGVHRTGALAVLREFTVALAAGDQGRAAGILRTISPDPDGDVPAASHVIGVSFGFLDARHTDPVLRGAFGRMRVPAWPSKPATKASRDIVALASKGGSFDALQSLHMRHTGLALFEGGALSVAASVIAQAAAEGLEVPTLAARVLTDAAVSRPARSSSSSSSSSSSPSPSPGASGAAFRRPSSGSATDAFGRPTEGTPTDAFGRPLAGTTSDAFGRPTGSPIGGPASGRLQWQPLDAALVREFRAWLETQALIAAPTVADEVQMFEALLRVADAEELDLREPDHIGLLIDVILDADGSWPKDAVGPALGTLDEYVHFQLETAADPEEWEDAHVDVEDALDGEGLFEEELFEEEGLLDVAFDEASEALSEVLDEAVLSSANFSEAERREALATTRIVARVRELLEWIGKGRGVAPSGGVQLADIAHGAGLLGVSAVGARKRPAIDDQLPLDFELGQPVPEPELIHARSMQDVPVLAAWWDALLATEIIVRAGTRVRPGPAAAEWAAEPLPPLALAEMVVGVYVAEVVGESTSRGFDPFAVALLAETSRRVLMALDLDSDAADEGPTGLAEILVPRALRRMQRLEQVGLLQADAENRLMVSPALRGPVARGLVLMMTFQDLADGLDDEV